jgi:hypothetical protein
MGSRSIFFYFLNLKGYYIYALFVFSLLRDPNFAPHFLTQDHWDWYSNMAADPAANSNNWHAGDGDPNPHKPIGNQQRSPNVSFFIFASEFIL